MVETMSVAMSGVTFALLQYEILKSTYSQEGFLLGEIVETKTTTITDNDQQQVRISRVVKINSVVPCPESLFFYDGVGRINRAKIRSFLGDKTEKVVAWYRYKRSSSLVPTFREKIIHKELTKLFTIPPEFVTCCLLTHEMSDNKSTHTFSQIFMKQRGENYEQVPFRIVNLSDPNNTYKNPEPVSETFSKLVDGLRINPETTQGCHAVIQINNALIDDISRTVMEIKQVEEEEAQLKKDVENLKAAAKNKESASNHTEDANMKEICASSSLKETDPEVSLISDPKKTKGKGRGACTARRGRGNLRKSNPEDEVDMVTNFDNDDRNDSDLKHCHSDVQQLDLIEGNSETSPISDPNKMEGRTRARRNKTYR